MYYGNKQKYKVVGVSIIHPLADTLTSKTMKYLPITNAHHITLPHL